LIPEKIRPVSRKSFHAYDGVNNLFNLGYELLFWKCYTSIIKAHLEAYLGFLHSDLDNRPNLVCDLQEPYRYLIDDFLIDFCSDLKTRDFILSRKMWNEKWGCRIYLNEEGTQAMAVKIREMFTRKVKITRLRNGQFQEIESAINEEAMLLGKYLRDEKPDWFPRIASLK
jgi:CRISPR-associated endonuclease Cas1